MRYLAIIFGILMLILLITSIRYRLQYEKVNRLFIGLEERRIVELESLKHEYRRQSEANASFVGRRIKIIEKYKATDDIVSADCDEKLKTIDNVMRLYYER